MSKASSKFKDSPILQIFLFLPLIIFMSGDLATLIANEVLIIADLNLTFQQIGIIIGIQYLFNGICTFGFGYMSDRWSRKYLLLLGGTLWVIASWFSGIAWNFWSLLVARMIASIGIAAISPVSFSLLSDLFPSEKRSNGFAWWGVANMIGGVFMSSIALAYNQIDFKLLDAMFGTEESAIMLKVAYIQTIWPELASVWRKPFILVAEIGTILTLLVLLIKEPKRAAKDTALRDVLNQKDVDYSRKYTIQPRDLTIILKRKTNLFLALNFFDTITSGIITAYLFSYLTLEIGINISFTNLNFDIILFGIALLLALGIAFWGQFFFSKYGDQRKVKGDIVGRIKTMLLCALIQIPFFTGGFLIEPSMGNSTIFDGKIPLSQTNFIIVFILMWVIIGIGLAGSFGGTPNWYASLIDGNLPEHRGTIIAIASLMDTIGRFTGAVVGGYILDLIHGRIGMMLVITGVIFGTISALMCYPILKTGKKDFNDVENTLKQRALDLQKSVIQKKSGI